MTHIDWQPIATMPIIGGPYLVFDGEEWGITSRLYAECYYSTQEMMEPCSKATHWAEIGELPK